MTCSQLLPNTLSLLMLNTLISEDRVSSGTPDFWYNLDESWVKMALIFFVNKAGGDDCN